MAVARDFHTVSLPPSEDEIKESLKRAEAQGLAQELACKSFTARREAKKIAPPNALFFCKYILAHYFYSVNNNLNQVWRNLRNGIIN